MQAEKILRVLRLKNLVNPQKSNVSPAPQLSETLDKQQDPLAKQRTHK